MRAMRARRAGRLATLVLILASAGTAAITGNSFLTSPVGAQGSPTTVPPQTLGPYFSGTGTISVPSGASTMTLTVAGGAGGPGGGPSGNGTPGSGGQGAQFSVVLSPPAAGAVYFYAVGTVGIGGQGYGSSQPNGDNAPGGPPDGGWAGSGGNNYGAGGGGGSTSFGICSGSCPENGQLLPPANRQVVAGGGGGGGNSRGTGSGDDGGAGGSAGIPTSNSTPFASGGTGGGGSNGCSGGGGGTDTQVGGGGSGCTEPGCCTGNSHGGTNGGSNTAYNGGQVGVGTNPSPGQAQGGPGGSTGASAGPGGGGGGGGYYGGGGGGGGDCHGAQNCNIGGAGGGGGSSWFSIADDWSITGAGQGNSGGGFVEAVFTFPTPTSTSSTSTTFGFGQTRVQPDVSARVSGGASFVGGGQLSPAPQETSASLAPDEEARFEIRIANGGSEGDRFRVAGNSSQNGYVASYFDGGNDVTAAVNAGTYATPRLDAGAVHTIVLAVRAPPASAGGTGARFAVRATAESDARAVDEVVVSVSKRGTTPLARTGEQIRRGITVAAAALGAGLVLWLLGVGQADRSRVRRTARP